MSTTIIMLVLLFVTINAWTDIGPNPIVLKSIMTDVTCEIQMKTETVDIDLYTDSSFVSCSFNMVNHGDSLTLPIGFPVMNFFHSRLALYDKVDKDKFEIYVDGSKLKENDIQVPERMKNSYNKYMKAVAVEEEFVRKQDSIKIKYGVIEKDNKVIYTKGKQYAYERASSAIFHWWETQPRVDSDLLGEFDSLMNNGNYAWYIWNVKFEKGESKTIKVNYLVPSGVGYGGEYRFIKYLVSTGTGWKDKICNAQINVRLKDIKTSNLESISPSNYELDEKLKVISWTFLNLEPTVDNDIYIRYFNPRERQAWQKFKKKRIRQINKSERAEKR